MLHQIFSDFILSAMLIPQRCYRSVTVVTMESNDLLSLWQNVIPVMSL